MTPGGPVDRALTVATVLAYAATLVAVATPGGAVLALVTHALLMAPGVAVLRAALPESWVLAASMGPVVGLGLSTTTMLALWALGGRGPWLFVAAPALAWLLVIPARRLRDRWRAPVPAIGDWRALLLVLLIVPLVVARPLSLVGADRPDGRVYRAYFTADYVWRRAIVAEVAKGEFPPRNPYYLRDRLHYYWLGHLPDAVEYRAVAGRVDMDDVLLGSSVLVDAAFVLVIFGLTRLVVPVGWAAAAGVAWAFFLTSFEGVAGIWVHVSQGLDWKQVRYLNIDAVTRWFFGGMPIDGIHRILWYQPHHALAYALGFVGLAMVARRRHQADPAVFAAAGAVFAICTLVSSFVALMAVASTAVYEGVGTLRARNWRAALVNAAWASLPLMLAVAVVTELQYIDHQPGNLTTLRLGLNELATRHVLASAFLSAGPILLVGAAGMWVAWRRRLADAWPQVAAIASAIVIYFYVDIRDHGEVYVGWRVGHVMFIALAPFVGLALLEARAVRGARRLATWSLVALLALAAAPMYAIDAYNTQDVENRAEGPSFRWTMLLTPGDLEGLRWLREHTSPDAVVQVDPYSRDSDTWGFIPAFAERRMAVGLPLGLVPLEKYQMGSQRLRWIYDAPDARGAFTLAATSGIDYLVVGRPERHDHPGVDARFAGAADLLPRVFGNDALTIYEVRRPGHVQ